MSETPKTTPPNTTPPMSPRRRRRPERVLGVAVILMVVLGAYQFHAQGYAFLIGSQEEPSPPDSKMTLMRCSYFTGTEKIINHTMRPSSDSRGKPTCPFTVKLNLNPAQNPNPYEIDIPGTTIKGGSRPVLPPPTPSEQVPPPPAAAVEPPTPSEAPPKP